jgi:integrase
LDTATELKTVAGESRGIQLKWTLQFLWTLKKEGIKETTAKMYWYYLTNLESHGASLYDPESVKAAIANMENWDTNTKASAVTAYSKYLQVFGGTWKKPRYKRERKIPFLPTEKELDCLMNASHKKLATYLRLLKETGIRANEAWQLKWIDIDIERSIITLNKTEKHGTPRNFRVSPGLIGMLNALPKKSDKVFNGSLIGFSKGFRRFRARIANKMQNPRLLEIHFHTYRHWFATMEYHRTKDILHVKERLGHKSVNTTEIYMHLIDFENDDFYSAAAGTIEEAKKLVESGFEYVCDVQDVKLFRKRK